MTAATHERSQLPFHNCCGIRSNLNGGARTGVLWRAQCCAVVSGAIESHQPALGQPPPWAGARGAQGHLKR